MDRMVSENTTGLFAVWSPPSRLRTLASALGASPVAADGQGQPEPDFQPHGPFEMTDTTTPSIVRSFARANLDYYDLC